MLPPKYLEDLPRKLTSIVDGLENEIISDIARHIVKANYLTETAQWQIYKAKQLRMSNGEIAKRIAQKTGHTRKEIADMMRTACFDALDPDTKIYERAGLDTEQFFRSKQFDRIVKQGIKDTNGLFFNFTKTTANTANKALERLLDQAYFKVISGACSESEIIRQTVRELADQGIRKIAYPSNHVDQADVAVRRAVVTGVNQTALKLSLSYAGQMGCDLVETTAHGGARPSHAGWQGKVFSLSGKHPHYPSFYTATGYGTGAGLGGWNCRHSFYPYFEELSEPAYTPEALAELNRKRYQYQGKDYTEYQASQKQRGFERSIRKIKRELSTMDSAMQAAKDKALQMDLDADFMRYSSKLKKQEQMLREFLRQTSRERTLDNARLQALGFGKSVSQKAVWADRKELLPNLKNVQIPREKLTEYALNKNHPSGKDKAVAFERALGYTVDNADELIKSVHRNLKRFPATLRSMTPYGQPYEVKMVLTGANGKQAIVTTGWIVDSGQTDPRLTSIYVSD